MTAILGISAFYRDSAAAQFVDGEIVAAAHQERFTRKKYDYEFPQNTIEYFLREAGLTPRDLDYVGFYDKPWLTFERLVAENMDVPVLDRVGLLTEDQPEAAELPRSARAATLMTSNPPSLSCRN